MHGKGKYSWQDGRFYEGEYYEDKKHGFGIYRWLGKLNLDHLAYCIILSSKMASNTKESGSLESSMVEENIFIRLERFVGDYFKMENVLVGSTI